MIHADECVVLFKPRTWPHRIIATSLVSTPYDVHTLGPSGVELGAWTMARRMVCSGVKYTMCFKAQGWYTMLSLIHINYTNRKHNGVCSWSIQTGMFCQLGCVALHNYTILQGRGYHSKSWTFGWILWQWSDRYWPIPNESLQGKSSFRSLLFVTSLVLIFNSNANLVSSRAVCDSNTFDIQGYRNETVTLRSRLLSRLILLAILYLCHSKFFFGVKYTYI